MCEFVKFPKIALLRGQKLEDLFKRCLYSLSYSWKSEAEKQPELHICKGLTGETYTRSLLPARAHNNRNLLG